MDTLITTLVTAGVAFFVFLIGEPIFRWFLRLIGLYAIIHEGTCHVYVLFGKVIGVIEEPGLQSLWAKLGLRGMIVNWLGRRYVIDMRLDQQYLRSLPVNSEEGAPMGIGIWYEMFISDPVAFLFKNTDPRGSLAANVSNSTVRSLSNMPLDDMLQTRHTMSRAVRGEVSPKSHEWGYQLGSVYIRKVHFRDNGMIRQIEEKVVNQLRQVTSAILQDGENRMNIITSSAERKAAVEFAKANAMRPKIVGEALRKISEDEEVASVLFDILETENILDSEASVTMLPQGGELLAQLMAAKENNQ